jgi:hypothetical protein
MRYPKSLLMALNLAASMYRNRHISGNEGQCTQTRGEVR